MRATHRVAAYLCIGLALFLGLVASVASGSEDEAQLAIVGATLVHPDRELSDATTRDAVILIRGNRIAQVGPASTTGLPRDAQVIDAHGKWIVPGLVDAHVHFFQSGNVHARPDVADFTGWRPYAQEAERTTTRLPATFKSYIASGVTGAVDTGGPLMNFELRELARRTPEAPRLAVAGPLVSTVARPQLDLGDPPIVRVRTPDEAWALVERLLPYRPDYVKMWFIHEPGDDLAQQEAIATAAGKAAHAAGVRFAVHATSLEVAKAALRAGADYLVHSVEDYAVDEEFISLARTRGVLYCPTLFVYEGYGLALSGRWRATAAESRLGDPAVIAGIRELDTIPLQHVPAWVRRMMREGSHIRTSPMTQSNLRKVLDAGIPVVVGSDAGNIGTLHGPGIFREMDRMQAAGLTPLEVLRAATVNGANAMGMERDLGVIAPGRLADLVIVDRDPLEDVGNLSQVYRVVKDGRVYDPDRLMESVR
jgi:imidazolonepropionase-like amidohydrolase